MGSARDGIERAARTLNFGAVSKWDSSFPWVTVLVAEECKYYSKPITVRGAPIEAVT